MRRAVAALVTGIVVVFGLGVVPEGAVSAAPSELTLHARQSSTHRVVVSGLSPRQGGTVQIERHTARGWATVARAPVERHRYRAHVVQRAASTRYRVSVGRQHSRVAQVRIRAAQVRHTLSTSGSPRRPTPAPTSTSPAPWTPDSAPPASVPGATGSTAATPTSSGPTPPPTTTGGPVTVDASSSGATAAGCGPTIRKADGTPWQCTFDDEFNGTSLDTSKWVPQEYFASGDPGNLGCAENDPDLINVSGGALHLSVNKTKPTSVWAPYCAYTEGMVSTYHHFSFQYGRIEARIKVAAANGPGLHEAFWMWPDDRIASDVTWPAAGEIDVAEQFSGLPDVAIPYLHYTPNDNGGYLPGTNTAFDCVAHRGVFNTFALEWTPTTMTFIINGRHCLVNTAGDSAFQKAYIIDLTQTIGRGLNAPDPSTPFPATMDVDYVRVWK